MDGWIIHKCLFFFKCRLNFWNFNVKICFLQCFFFLCLWPSSHYAELSLEWQSVPEKNFALKCIATLSSSLFLLADRKLLAVLVLLETVRQLPAEIHHQLVGQEVQAVQSCAEPLVLPRGGGGGGDHSRGARYETESMSQCLPHFKKVDSLWILESLEDPSV